MPLCVVLAISHVHALLKDLHEVRHTEAVHMIQYPHLVYDKVQQCSAYSDGYIGFSGLHDLEFSLLCDARLFIDVARSDFSAFQAIDELYIGENISLRSCKPAGAKNAPPSIHSLNREARNTKAEHQETYEQTVQACLGKHATQQ